MSEIGRRFNWDTIALSLLALGFLVFGAISFAWPGSIGLVEVGVLTPMARTEIRAVYGGFELGLAAFLFACATRPELRRVGLLAALCVSAGSAAARILSMSIEAQGGLVLWVLAAIETTGALIALGGWLATFKKKAPAPAQTISASKS